MQAVNCALLTRKNIQFVITIMILDLSLETMIQVTFFRQNTGETQHN